MTIGNESGKDTLEKGAWLVRAAGPLRGRLRVPGDKSISHRAVMLASMAEGRSTVEGFLRSEDCVNTLLAFERMGVHYQDEGGSLLIDGAGASGLIEPDNVIDMGNSGTGVRLLMGALAGQPFCVTLTGDSSLRRRPMGRIVEPLRAMGAEFLGRACGDKLPISLRGGSLTAIDYTTPVPSAQIKSAALLAGLNAKGVTIVREAGPSRDHTERMLQTFGVEVEIKPGFTALRGGQSLRAQNIQVPTDISSAAFFLVAACIVPDSELILEAVGMNPTRTGLIEVLREMGADIDQQNERSCGLEPVADLRVRSAPLRGTRVSGDTVVRMIDEFPIFAVAAAFASSPSVVEGAEELRVKESDRIAAVVCELGKMGANIEERPDGFIVSSGEMLGAQCASYGDHRIAMSLAVAALASKGETCIQGTAPVATSFPGFADLLNLVAPGSVENIGD